MLPLLQTPARLSSRKRLAATATMGLSKTNRIIILLVIDSAFFLLELITGLSLIRIFTVDRDLANVARFQAMPSTRSLSSPIPFTWYGLHFTEDHSFLFSIP